MKNKIDEININQDGFMIKGKYHFLNNDDFNELCERLLHNNEIWQYRTNTNTNIIKIGLDIYIKFNGDLSDLGNDIGLNIGEYIDKDKIGYEKDDLISGIRHGISIIDGSHVQVCTNFYFINPEKVDDIATDMHNRFCELGERQGIPNSIRCVYSIGELSNINVDSTHHLGNDELMVKVGHFLDESDEPGIYKI